MDDQPIAGRGTYTFNLDDLDENTDPFAPSKSLASSPPKRDAFPGGTPQELTPERDSDNNGQKLSEENSSPSGDLDINENSPRKQTRIKKPQKKTESKARSKFVKPAVRKSPDAEPDIEIFAPPPKNVVNDSGDGPSEMAPPKQTRPPKDPSPRLSPQPGPGPLENVGDVNDLSPIDGGIVASSDIGDDEFRPANEVFNDTAAWDILETFGKGRQETSSLARESLYVRFDPLLKKGSPVVNAAKSGPAREESIPEVEEPIQVNHGINGDEDLLMMHTPPTSKPKLPPARQLQKKIAHPSPRTNDLDKIFEVQSDEDDNAIASPEPWQRSYKPFCELEEPVSTAGLSQDSLDDLDCEWEKEVDGRPDSPVQFDHEELLKIDERHDGSVPEVSSAPSSRVNGPTATVLPKDPGIVEVLKYSDSDLAKFKMEQQARLLAKERDWNKRENDLLEEINQHKLTIDKMTQSNEDMQKIVAEYERTVSQVIVDKAKLTSTTEESLNDAVRERNQAVEQLRTMESAFSDLHGRYEKAKVAVETLKANEEELKKCITDYQNKIKKHEQRYQLLKQHAEEKLQSANEEIDKVHKSKNSELARVQAALKRSELQVSSLENSLQQKVQENKELTSICDDLIKQVGGDG